MCSRLGLLSGRVAVRLDRLGGWAVIEVSDSGRGISSEDLPKVFDRFYRGRQHSGRGSGIGLAVVRELTEAHGGRAVVESPCGSGALFRVMLPIDAGASPADPELQPASRAATGVPA